MTRGRKRFLLSLQPAQITTGNRGYASSGPLPQGALIESVILESDTASGLVVINFGVAAGAVASQADAAAAQSGFIGLGSIISQAEGIGVPIPNGTVYITGLGWLVPSSLMRVFVEVINGSGSSIRANATFIGDWLTEDEYYRYGQPREVEEIGTGNTRRTPANTGPTVP